MGMRDLPLPGRGSRLRLAGRESNSPDPIPSWTLGDLIIRVAGDRGDHPDHHVTESA